MAQSILQRVQQAALKLLLPLDSKILYKTCITEAVRLSGAKYGSLFIEKNDRLVRVFSNVPKSIQLTPRVGGEAYQSFLDGQMRIIPAQIMQQNHPESGDKARTVLLLPLTYQTKRVGVISLKYAKLGELSPSVKESLQLFSSLATLAIRNLELYERSQAAVQTRELFMSTAAHELKTPLAAIQAYAQLIQKKITSPQSIQPQWVEALLSSSSRLQILIKDLFTVSQMKMGVFTYTFDTVPLFDLVKKVVNETKLLHSRTIHFTASRSALHSVVEADGDKLELVFTNLLGNAVKFSSADSAITVKLSQKNKTLKLLFIDQGEGIADEDLPHVFEKFYQGKHNGSNGLGLGMYLCKDIVQAHHGEIRLQSQKGMGTQVEVLLPVA